MTRITNADHVLALLRAQLERAERVRKRGAKTSTSATGSTSATDRVRYLAAQEPSLSEPEIERALVAALLTDELGASVASEPSYQRMVDEVLSIIRRDDPAKALLKRATARLSDGA